MIKDNIKKLRQKHGLTQSELGRIAGVSELSGKWSALTVPCDLKIKNARPNKCFGGLRRTCQTCEQEQKRETHVSGLTAGRCTLRLLACQRSGFLYTG